MRAKPEMKPWVFTDKNKMSSVGAALTARVLGHLLWGCAAPTGLKKNVYQCLTQGLRPGLCRGVALTGLVSVSASLKLEWGRGGSIVLILPYYAMVSCLAWG